MIIKQNLAGFYDKSEVEFLGKEIDFKYMTPAQLNKTIADSITLYNKLYPPPPKSGFDKFMSAAAKVTVIGGLAVVTGGAVLAAYGVGMGTALGTVFGAGSATAAAGSTIASIQTAASAVAGAGILYGKVTGDTPEDLVKAAELIKSENALEAMEKVATEELNKKGVAIQAEDEASNAALRAKLKQEQNKLSERLLIEADNKAKMLGQDTPTKKKAGVLEIAAVATPFILYFLR